MKKSWQKVIDVLKKEGCLNQGELAKKIGMAQSNLSPILKEMEWARLVKSEKSWKTRFYTLNHLYSFKFGERIARFCFDKVAEHAQIPEDEREKLGNELRTAEALLQDESGSLKEKAERVSEAVYKLQEVQEKLAKLMVNLDKDKLKRDAQFIGEAILFALKEAGDTKSFLDFCEGLSDWLIDIVHYLEVNSLEYGKLLKLMWEEEMKKELQKCEKRREEVNASL